MTLSRAAEEHLARAAANGELDVADRLEGKPIADLDILRASVAAANVAIDTANLNLIESDRIAHFDLDDIVERWRRVRR